MALLIMLDAMVLASLLFLLIQPVYRKSSLKEGGCRVVLLGDCSGSMAVCDMLSGNSRRQALAEVYVPEHVGRTECIAFAGSMSRVTDFGGSAILPGASPAGSHLREILRESEKSVPLGAVILFSDGAVNEGHSLTEVAKEYRRRGVPVSCVGLGGDLDMPDYSVRWIAPVMSVMRDEKCVLTAVVEGTAPAELELTFSGAEGIIEKRKINFNAGPVKVHFDVRPRTEGVHSYMLAVDGLSGETRKDNNAAFAAVEAEAPPVFRVLSLLAGPDWEQRFLNQFSAGNSQFETASIVMLAEGRLAVNGMPDGLTVPEKEFPQETAIYENFDIVILDGRAASLLGERGASALRTFVENKGGGLVIRGPVNEMPDVIADMLPAPETETVQFRKTVKLKFRTDFIFGKDRTGLLNGGQGIFLTCADDMYFLPGSKRKSARAIAELDMPHGRKTIAAGMSFGAGRVVQTGLESTWRWCLAGNGIHSAWWSNLFMWLAEAAKPRVREMNGRMAQIGEEFLLDLAILDDDFLPAPDAQVTALMQGPDGVLTEFVLEPSPDGEGRYSTAVHPEKQGKYLISYRIKLPGRTLVKETFLMAVLGGREMENTSFNGTLLRDVARISGGHYFNAEDFDLSKVPLSDNIPKSISIKRLASSWPVAVVFVLSACVLCAVRRRFGLK